MQPHPGAGHPFIDGAAKQLFIDGRWCDALSGRTFDSFNPATGLVLAGVAEGGSEDIDLAVAAARRALDGPWGRFKPADRQKLLLRIAELLDRDFEEFATLDSLDMGAPVQRTRAGRDRMIGTLQFYASLAVNIRGDTISTSMPGQFVAYTVKEPVGVVGAIIPWNGPTTATVWKVGPALATGCTIVLKPAEQAPLTALRFARLCDEAGVPPGVINVVTGPGRTAGAALAAHPGVDKVAFTGSNATGQAIMRAAAGNLKKLSLELGGKSPDIVFADADLDAAAPGAAMAVFANSGQICSAGTRLFVQRPVYDAFVEKVADFGRSLRIGDSLDAETQIGPLVSSEQLARVTKYLEIGRQEGARRLSGDGPLPASVAPGGYFVQPTVFADVGNSMRIAREEIFGPVIAAIPFDDPDEAIALANDSDFGLGGGVWTRDISNAHRVANALKVGSVWVNCYQAMDPALPFGGYKTSGFGKEAGHQHVEEYLNTKSVCIRIG